MFKFLQARFSRGFSFFSVGPNESRLIFDGAASVFAAFVAAVFSYSWSRKVEYFEVAALLPICFLACNAVLGIYSRFRKALARVKALLLLASVVIASAIGWTWIREIRFILLWAILVSVPVVLTRLLVSLYTDRHRALKRIVTNREGPVLVIGGAGYIGSHTVDLILRSGREVRVLDSLMYGDASLQEFKNHPRFSFVDGDTTDISKLTRALQDCSAVVHLAGLVGDPACAVNPDFTRHTNIIATRMAREVAQAMGVRRFVFASSCSVYGVSDSEVSETDELNPVSLYAQTKIDSEEELLANVPDDFFVTVLRFATVFGHSLRPRFDLVGNLFSAQAMTDGRITVIGPNQWRPFVHVRDLARAILAVLDADEGIVQSQIFNVGDKRLNMTILQLAERVQHVVSEYREVELSITDNPQDRRNYCVSFAKIHQVLGFQAETMIEDGVKEIVEHFKKGTYENYRSAEYSNLAMTAKALASFQDPDRLSNLYAPIGERLQAAGN